MLDNKLLKQSNIKGTFQLDFYPVTQWSAIVDAPSFEDNDGKVLNVTNNQLSWTGIKTINGESLFGDGNIEITGTGTQSDWSINDIEDPAYVFNRTHYVEESVLHYGVEETSPVNEETSNSWLYLLQNLTEDTESWDLPDIDSYILACKSLLYNDYVFNFGELRHILVDGDNLPYYGNLFLAKDVLTQFGIDTEDTGEDYLLFVFAFAGVIFAIKKSLYQENASIVTNIERPEEIVHKLDNKFLNDIPVSKIEGLAAVATTNDYYSLDNRPSISFGTLQTDVNYGLVPSLGESFSMDIQLHKISKTGNYNDLLSKPTKLSEFTNDVGFITSSEQQVYYGEESGMIDSLVMRIRLSVNDISNVSFENCILDILFPDYGIPTNGKFRFFDLNGNCYMVNGEPVDFSVYYHDGTITAGRVNAGDEVLISNQGGLYVLTNDAWSSTFSGDYNDLSNKPAIPVVPTDVSAFNNDAGYATQTYVDTAIGNLPEPMIFKGSLGTGGTITTLPAASSSNEGYVYKVITDGTYASQAAKVGDTFISTGSSWVLIPSGDEPSGTVTSVGVSVPTGLSVSGTPVTSSGTIAISLADGYSIPTTTKQGDWDAKQNAINSNNKLSADYIQDGTTNKVINVKPDWNAASGADTEILNKPAIHNIPAGGNAGQVLKKTSATDYDVNWANASETLPSAYCTTSGSTAAKKANCSLYVTQANQYLQVLIGSANTYQGALTLNINSAGAKPIYINGTASSSSNYTLPNGTYFVFYDGTNYYFRTDGKLPMKDVAFGGSYNDLADKPATIPTPTSADENKLLSVDSNGAYVLVTILNSENIAY